MFPRFYFSINTQVVVNNICNENCIRKNAASVSMQSDVTITTDSNQASKTWPRRDIIKQKTTFWCLSRRILWYMASKAVVIYSCSHLVDHLPLNQGCLCTVMRPDWKISWTLFQKHCVHHKEWVLLCSH